MKMTLFIDESGDFTTSRGRWLLAGLVIPLEYEIANRILSNALGSFPKEFGYKGIKSLHLTEMRQAEGHSEAVTKAEIFLNRALGVSANSFFIGTINHSKIQVSGRETTYRLMLVDMLSVIESVVPEGEHIERLDLVIAKRTIDGVPQTTNEIIKYEVLGNLPQSLEVDLASRGIVDLLGRKVNVQLQYANDSWGLVTADFLANILYNGEKNLEHKLIKTYEANSKLKILKSFAQLDRRRALVAELNGNNLLAITRWMEIFVKERLREDLEELKRCLIKFIYESGTSWSTIGFESLIDRIWRLPKSGESWQLTVRYLDILAAVLEDISDELSKVKISQLKFRINNLKVKALNHIGDTEQVANVIAEQKGLKLGTASNPDLLMHALDFELIKCEFYFNELNFDRSEQCAKTFYSLVDNYTELSALLYEHAEVDKLESALYRKALLNLLRHQLNTDMSSDPEQLRKALCDIDNCATRADSSFEISRCVTLKAMVYVCLEDYGQALSICIKHLTGEPSNLFVLGLAFKICGIELANGNELNQHEINILREWATKVEFSPTHPKELLYRNMSVIEFMRGNNSDALNLLRKSNNAMLKGSAKIIALAIDINSILSCLYKGNNALALKGYKKFLTDYGLNHSQAQTDKEIVFGLLSSSAM